MKLLYAPGACSLGIHVILEEIGKPYEAARVNLRNGAQHEAAFTSVNPKSKVPTLLRDDGSVLTEFPAVAWFLARSNPQSKLLPDDIEGEARALESMDYVVATIHMQGFTRMFLPERFGDDVEKVKATGRRIFDKGLVLMNDTLGGRDYLGGSIFSVADAALFYVEFWGVGMGIDLPAGCAAHYRRMLARPTVRTVMSAEGLNG